MWSPVGDRRHGAGRPARRGRAHHGGPGQAAATLAHVSRRDRSPAEERGDGIALSHRATPVWIFWDVRACHFGARPTCAASRAHLRFAALALIVVEVLIGARLVLLNLVAPTSVPGR